jgi:hypothetical protein
MYRVHAAVDLVTCAKVVITVLPGQGDLPLAVKLVQRGVGVPFCATTRCILVGNATLVVAAVPTCNLHFPKCKSWLSLTGVFSAA